MRIYGSGQHKEEVEYDLHTGNFPSSLCLCIATHEIRCQSCTGNFSPIPHFLKKASDAGSNPASWRDVSPFDSASLTAIWKRSSLSASVKGGRLISSCALSMNTPGMSQSSEENFFRGKIYLLDLRYYLLQLFRRRFLPVAEASSLTSL